MSDPFVSFRKVSFKYPVFEVTNRSLKVSMLRAASSNPSGIVEIQALRDVSFEARSGERLAIIGRNGSGKSTTLRLLAGLAKATSGEIEINGRVVPLIEKGLGINPELTGMANIELPMRLLGATSAEVKLAKEEIPEFTGLEQFINLPVRTYSEGMKTRLAFAICTALSANVLLLDEWLSAGDLDFHQKAEARLNAMLDKTEIVVLVTHSLELALNVATKIAWIDRGNLVMCGDPRTVANAYVSSTHRLSSVKAAV